MNIVELHPVYDSRASFYGKAKVLIDEHGNQRLQSYDTIVAELSSDGTLKLNGRYSITTGRHIREFLRQNGLPNMSKKEIEAFMA